MLNNDIGKQKDVEQNQNGPSQWAQILGQVTEKVVAGTNMRTTIEFDNLEVDVPKAIGPNGRDLGGATWKLNGKVVWTTEAHRGQGSI
jgi:hypothetical protein